MKWPAIAAVVALSCLAGAQVDKAKGQIIWQVETGG